MATVNSKMTAIADEIRTLTNTTEAMGLDAMATNINDANAATTTQESLISQIQTALIGKAGGSSDTTATVTNNSSLKLYCADLNNNIVCIGQSQSNQSITCKIPTLAFSDNVTIPGMATVTGNYISVGMRGIWITGDVVITTTGGGIE